MYLKDYIDKYKDENLTKETFFGPDAALLALFSLCDLSNIIPPNKAIKFKDAMIKQNEIHKTKKLGLLLPLSITHALEEASISKRYRSIKIHDSYTYINEDEITQTTIFQMDLKDDTTVVVFGGTDDTIVGWKEDYDLIYGEVAPCLKHSLDYVNTRLRSDRKYIFVGHSKGGMEALYAGLLYEKYQHNVLEIISLDGPGFVDSILETLNKSPYKHKARLIVPDGSVVGRIFKQPIDYTIVYSNEYGLLQHNPLSWKILGHEFGVVPSFREGTEKLSKTINETAATFSVEELKEFEKDFFDTLSSGGSKCLLDTPFHFFSIQKAFVSLSLKQKKLFLKFMSYIIDSRLVSKDIMFPSIRIKYNKDKQD